ncbi:MAG: alpha/beta hydrolase [Microthrixaceae bacterium]|nr:alpha/beta hydrolase [Microthrixaceae bacterium]
MTSPVELRHNRVKVVLHTLAAGPEITGGRAGTRPLLLLHGLGERTARHPPAHLRWPGPVFGLDFTGHGSSTVPVGGGYTSEVLVGDVDAALCHLDRPVTVLGRGLGAYVGLLAAAARPDAVHGTVLADGPGFAGGGVDPGSRSVIRPEIPSEGGSPDQYALMELSDDVRPPDYARTLAGFAVDGSGQDTPIWVAATVRPPWVEAILEVPGVASGTLQEGLDGYC